MYDKDKFQEFGITTQLDPQTLEDEADVNDDNTHLFKMAATHMIERLNDDAKIITVSTKYQVLSKQTAFMGGIK